MTSYRRLGFSLMEVIMASAILLGAVIVLTELASLGSRSARRAQSFAESQIFCQTKLNELVSGVSPIEPIERRLLEDSPDWFYSVESKSVPGRGLLKLQVTVWQENKSDKRDSQFSLSRWIADRSILEISNSDKLSPATDEGSIGRGGL